MDRYKFQSIAENIGVIRHAIFDEIGDTSRNPATQLKLETALTRIYGSTVFHDEDISRYFLQFQVKDNVGLGLQSVEINSPVTTPIYHPDFPNYKNALPTYFWKPEYPAPCPEGWNIFDYHIWKNYLPASGVAWSGVTGENINDRSGYEYPVRYSGYAGYERVSLFDSGRFLTFKNTTGDIIEEKTIAFTLTKEQLSGIKIVELEDDTISVDINIYWHPELVMTDYSPIASLSIANGDKLNRYNDPSDLSSPKFIIEIDNSGDFVFTMNVPPSPFTWASNDYWHVIIYWGSTDDNVPLCASGFSGYSVAQDILTISQYRKNYFTDSIVDNFGYNYLGINDTSGYIVANNRTNYIREDGEYTNPTIPEKYSMPLITKSVEDSNSWTDLPAIPTNAIDNKVVGYSDISFNDNSVIPITMCVKTGDSVIPRILAGPELTPEFFPDKWENCSYFHPVPDDYIEIAKFIVSNSPGELYGLPENGTIFSKDPSTTDNNISETSLSVIWMQQSIQTFAEPQVNDENVFLYILSALRNFVLKIRNINIQEIISYATFRTMVPFAGTPEYLASRLGDVLNASGNASTVFRGLMKSPNDADMMLDGQPVPIYLTSDARESVADTAGLPASVDFLRFDANNLYLTKEMLKTPNQFEIYQSYADQCSTVDLGVGGNKLNNDYTLRIELVDGDQNILKKDWYVMASKYFLTQEEYNQQQQTTQGVLGYFTQDTLDLIDEWRLYGYAGFVPDLSVGKAKPLSTRLVSPPDATQITEEEFRKRLSDQGMDETEIDDRVLIYEDNGGTFYTVDSNQYSDYFVGINNAALTTTAYTYASEPYWKTVFPDYFATAKMDAFTIAASGFTVGELESDLSLTNILGAFNREISSAIPPPNDLRSLNVSYTMEGFWGFNIKKFTTPQIVTIYPRAMITSASGTAWGYIPNDRDIHVFARMSKGNNIINSYKLIPAGNIAPVALSDVPVDGLVFLSIAKGYDTYSVKLSTVAEADISFNIFKNNVIYTNTNVTELDGVTLSDDDRVLVQHLVGLSGINQKYNGIYNYAVSASGVNGFPLFIRAEDMNDSSEIYDGLAVRVLDGVVHKNQYYTLDIPATDYPVRLNQTDIAFSGSSPTMPTEFSAPKYGGALSDKFTIRSR